MGIPYRFRTFVLVLHGTIDLNRMMKFVNHIARFRNPATLVLTLVVVGVVGSIAARADKTKKTAVASTISINDLRTLSALRYGMPFYGAMETSILALGTTKQQTTQTTKSTTSTQGKTQVREADTTRTSRIVFVRATSDVFNTRIDLVQDETTLDLGIYNMLGKKVMDVYRGPERKGEHDYSLSISELPEGVYICIMQGSNYRRAEKFYISR